MASLDANTELAEELSGIGTTKFCVLSSLLNERGQSSDFATMEEDMAMGVQDTAPTAMPEPATEVMATPGQGTRDTTMQEQATKAMVIRLQDTVFRCRLR